MRSARVEIALHVLLALMLLSFTKLFCLLSKFFVRLQSHHDLITKHISAYQSLVIVSSVQQVSRLSSSLVYSKSVVSHLSSSVMYSKSVACHRH